MSQDNSLMVGNLSPTPQCSWTSFENKLFEEALAMYSEETAAVRWQKIADRVPGKSPEDVRAQYESLVRDLSDIESGRVEVPSYSDDLVVSEPTSNTDRILVGLRVRKHSVTERKKGTPWTQEEHRQFLRGLHIYEKGDWRSISRNLVPTRTPSQVASHAQKYFIRQRLEKKERKRSSIHDITTIVDTSPVPPPPTDFPNQGGPMGYQNFNFPTMQG